MFRGQDVGRSYNICIRCGGAQLFLEIAKTGQLQLTILAVGKGAKKRSIWGVPVLVATCTASLTTYTQIFIV